MLKPLAFQGRWRIETRCAEAVFSRRITIRGSDNADGHYEPGPPDVPTLVVEGQAWTVALERMSEEVGAGTFVWRARPSTRTTRFGRNAGLVVVLSSAEMPGLSLTCTCLDPALGYSPVPKPFDFTRPEG